MQKIGQLLKKYKELVLYVVFGALTTLVNIVVFWALGKTGMHELIANVIAWAASVAFAFITNKIYVFESKSFEAKVFWPELWKFVVGRIATGILDEIIIYVSITLLNPDAGDLYKLTWKVISNVIVIILNFIISKLLIFKKEKGKENETSGNEN